MFRIRRGKLVHSAFIWAKEAKRGLDGHGSHSSHHRHGRCMALWALWTGDWGSRFPCVSLSGASIRIACGKIKGLEKCKLSLTGGHGTVAIEALEITQSGLKNN